MVEIGFEARLTAADIIAAAKAAYDRGEPLSRELQMDLIEIAEAGQDHARVKALEKAKLLGWWRLLSTAFDSERKAAYALFEAGAFPDCADPEHARRRLVRAKSGRDEKVVICLKTP